MQQRIKDDIEFILIVIFGIAGLIGVFAVAFWACYMPK